MTALTVAGTSRLWLWLAGAGLGLALIFGALWLAYSHGRSVEKGEWQALWNDRDARDAKAKLTGAETERAKEQAHQRAIDQVQADAEKQIDTALTQAADAATAADGLRQRVNQLLAADRASRSSCATAGSTAAETPGNLLAVVLDKSVARNRELAALADSARIAGLACEAAYNALRVPP